MDEENIETGVDGVKVDLQGNFIYSDVYRTKDLIWGAYDGFCQLYAKYRGQLITFNGQANIHTELAMIEKVTDLYFELDSYFEQLKSVIDKKEMTRIIGLFEIRQRYSEEDYMFMRKFFSRFMDKSGIRSIVKKREDLSETIKKNR